MYYTVRYSTRSSTIMSKKLQVTFCSHTVLYRTVQKKYDLYIFKKKCRYRTVWYSTSTFAFCILFLKNHSYFMKQLLYNFVQYVDIVKWQVSVVSCELSKMSRIQWMFLQVWKCTVWYDCYWDVPYQYRRLDFVTTTSQFYVWMDMKQWW